MSGDEGGADLHMHTTASDGTDDVETRIDQAVERDLDLFAVTDHDVVGDWFEAPTTTVRGVEVITGVEVRADIFDTKIEILGYFVDPADQRLRDALATARRYRTERNEEMVDRLSEATGLDLSHAAMAAAADGTLGRPHMAERLVEEGVVDSVGEAFDTYLGTEGAAYVPMQRLPYDEVIDAIHAAGGATSLAHPGRIRSDRVPEMVDRLADAGLDGIEVRYPYGDSGPDAYADVGPEKAAEMAEAHGLVATGGSDCHGRGSGKFRIGTVRVSNASVRELRAAVDRTDRKDQDRRE